MRCPKPTDRDYQRWQILLKKYSPALAYSLLNANKEIVPTLQEAEEIRKEYGFEKVAVDKDILRRWHTINKDDKLSNLPWDAANRIAAKLINGFQQWGYEVKIQNSASGMAHRYNVTVQQWVPKTPPQTMFSVNPITNKTQDLTNDFYLGDEALREQEQNYQLKITSAEKANEKLDSILKQWIQKAGFTYKGVDALVDTTGAPISAIARVNMFNKLIEVIEDKADISTLSEECAHMFVTLTDNEPLLQRMKILAKQSSLYSKVVADYGEIYEYNEEKLINETVGKLIAQEIIKNYSDTELQSKETPGFIQNFTSLFNKLLNFLKNKLATWKIFSKDFIEEVSPFTEAANQILEKQITGLDLLQSQTANDVYYELDVRMQSNRQEILEALQHVLINRDMVNGGYVKVDGTPVSNRVSDIIAKKRKAIFKVAGTENDKNTLLAKKGTILHAYYRYIMEALIKGQSIDQKDIVTQVLDNIQKEPDFNAVSLNKIRGMMNLTTTQYKSIVGLIRHLYSRIIDNQREINKATKTNGEFTILTEQIIYDEHRDIAGTCDLLVVYSNGVCEIYDYKNKQFKEVKGKIAYEIGDKQRLLYEAQITAYKNILDELVRDYQINAHQKDVRVRFAATRMIPVNIQLNIEEDTNNISYYGFSKIETIVDKVEHLHEISVAKELTHTESLNKALDKLYTLKSSIQSILEQNPNDKSRKGELARINKTIEAVLLERDFSYVFKDVQELKMDFDKRIRIPSDIAGALTMENIKEMSDRLNAWEKFIENSREYLESTNDKELIDSMANTLNIINGLKWSLRDQTINLIKDSQKIDLRAPGEKLSWAARNFSQLSNINSPIARALSRTIKLSQENIYKDTIQFLKSLQDITNRVKDWATSQNLTLQDAFDQIVDKSQGTLIKKFKPEFFVQLNSIGKNRKTDLDFIFKYFQVANKAKTKTGFTYTGEALIRFNQISDKFKERIANVKGTNEEDIVLEEYNSWLNKNDIANNRLAITNKKNQFIKFKYLTTDPNILNTLYSDEYKTILEVPVLTEYYQMWESAMNYAEAVTGRSISSRFIPEIRRDIIQNVQENGLLGVFDMKNMILNSMESIEESEIDLRTMEEAIQLDENGKPIKKIPLFYTHALTDTLTKSEIQKVKQTIDPSLNEGSDEYKQVYKLAILKAQEEKGLKKKSYDLSFSLLKFMQSVYTYQYMSEIAATTDNILAVAASEEVSTLNPTKQKFINRTYNDFVKISGLPNSDLKAYEDFVNFYVYGKKSEEVGTFSIGDKTMSGTKLMKSLKQYASFAMLGLKPVLGFRAAMQDTLGTILQMTENIYFNKEELKKGFKLFKNKDFRNVMEELFHTGTKDLIASKARSLQSTSWNKILNSDSLYLFLEAPDSAIDHILLLTMLNSWGYDEKTNNIRRISFASEATPLIDLLQKDENGAWSLDKVSPELFTKFRNLVQAASTATKGVMPDNDSMLISRGFLGTALMYLRTWIPGLARTRFQKLQHNDKTEAFDEGRFRVLLEDLVMWNKESTKVFGRLLVSSIPILGWYNGKNVRTNQIAAEQQYNQYMLNHPELSKAMFTFDSFVEMRINKLKAMASEIRSVITLFMLAQVAKALVPEPKHSDDNMLITLATQNFYRCLYGSFLEASFFISPNSITSIIDSPFPLLSWYTNMLKAGTNGFDELRDWILDKDYSGGLLLGQPITYDKTGWFYYTSKSIPIVNAIQDTFDLNDTFTFNMR